MRPENVTDEEMKAITECLRGGLPKWPQMKVTGIPVTVEQAKEIIRRTDNFFNWGGGNNHAYNRRVRKTLGMGPDWSERDRDHPGPTDQERRWNEHLFKGAWGYIRTQYVSNSWISCAFVGGPHGWCHPDGHIGYVDNVGKWPDPEDVFSDWKQLAEVFPFLHLGVTLMDKEGCEEGAVPVISFIVSKGKVTPYDPNEVDVHAGHPEACRRAGESDDTMEFWTKNLHSWGVRDGSESHENGLPWEWIEEWAQKYPVPRPDSLAYGRKVEP